MKDNRGRTNAIEIAQLQNARCSTALRGNNIETPDQMYDAMCKQQPYLDSKLMCLTSEKESPMPKKRKSRIS